MVSPPTLHPSRSPPALKRGPHPPTPTAAGFSHSTPPRRLRRGAAPAACPGVAAPAPFATRPPALGAPLFTSAAPRPGRAAPRRVWPLNGTCPCPQQPLSHPPFSAHFLPFVAWYRQTGLHSFIPPPMNFARAPAVGRGRRPAAGALPTRPPPCPQHISNAELKACVKMYAIADAWHGSRLQSDGGIA